MLAFHVCLCHAFHMRIILLMILFSLVSCATSSTRSVTNRRVQQSKKMTKISVDKSKDQEFQREQALVLRSKNRGLSSVPSRTYPQQKKIVMTGQLLQSKNENQLLLELQDQFDLNNLIGFQARYQAYMSQYGKSQRAGEAYYMAGLLHLSGKNYGQALKSFDLILRQSRTSPQASKALFAKAMTYSRLGLNSYSRDLLTQVQKQYPQTLEAQRAELEIKILEKRFQ